MYSTNGPLIPLGARLCSLIRFTLPENKVTLYVASFLSLLVRRMPFLASFLCSQVGGGAILLPVPSSTLASHQ